MNATLEDLTPGQLARIYNHHAETPVKKFENRQKGARRLADLLARIEVTPADAIAATIIDTDAWAYKPGTITPKVELPANDAVLPDNPDWTPSDIGFGDKIKDDERVARDDLLAEAAEANRAKGTAATEAFTAKFNATPAAAEPTPAVTGRARTMIAAACSRAEGATSKDLFEITGWKFASWSHQMKLITKEAGIPHDIRRVDGTVRYFLTGSR